MTKQEIIRSMQKASTTQGFITASQFARYMGRTNISKCKERYLTGLDRIDNKYYFIPEVAAVLMSRRDSVN